MMKIVTIDDVAKAAGVSKSTVSQYLNKRFDYMSAKTKERIAVTINELGYQPNIVARSLKQKSTSTIGVIVANILHAFSTQVIRAIEDVCREFDFHIIVCNADDDPEKEKKYIDMLRAKQVDGMIIFPTGGNLALYQRMNQANYPIVFLDRYVPDVHVASIMLDNAKAARIAVGHLAEKGYSRIGIITTSITKNVSPRVERINGYKLALSERGLPVREQYIKSLEVNQIQAGIKEMLLLDKPPHAIIAGNDLTLIQLLKFIKANDLKIPEDLALIGIDDVSYANILSPALTTIAQPTFDMGMKAATLLLSKIQNSKEKDAIQIYRFEPKLIVRAST